MKEEFVELKIAVMSDLHCHHSRQFGKNHTGLTMDDSYLKTDLPRKPSSSHPIESLIETLDSVEISDYLLCPGDLTNQVDIQGFICGWDFVREVATVLNVDEDNIIATLGNHDVDSRYNRFDEVFQLAKSIGKGFPIKDSKCSAEFWGQGFCFIERSNVRILVFNSVSFHSNTDESVKGRIDNLQLDGIEKYLKKEKKDKVQIALFHHHPVEHSKFDLGTEDTIEQGGQLMDLLNKYDFDLVVHGHKHHPWLRYSISSSAYSVPIFSSGSFSMKSSSIVTGAKNTFHLIHLKKKKKSIAKGTIKTWEYLPNQGWRLANSGDEFFPEFTGFGFNGDIEDLVSTTEKIISKESNGVFMQWEDFIDKLPEVNNLTPEQILIYRDKIKMKNIITNPTLPRIPEIIGIIKKG